MLLNLLFFFCYSVFYYKVISAKNPRRVERKLFLLPYLGEFTPHEGWPKIQICVCHSFDWIKKWFSEDFSGLRPLVVEGSNFTLSHGQPDNTHISINNQENYPMIGRADFLQLNVKKRPH